jgi:hypothetical protein
MCKIVSFAGGIAAYATAYIDGAGNVLLQTPYGTVYGEHYITMLQDCNNQKGTYSVTVQRMEFLFLLLHQDILVRV